MANKHHKKILLGITGGIAAYKAAELARLFISEGHQVRVVMTASACEFITPLTLQALTGNAVHHALLDEQAEMGMGHIELARWADSIVIAPASANVIARLNAGMADDLLTTVCLASQAPIFIAPAMNQLMWSNPITQQNINSLKHVLAERLTVLGPASGVQACGDVGFGRMLEPVDICAQVGGVVPQTSLRLNNLNLVISAGPTQEAIDPVRYISNRSSGKMGYALAESAQKLGANVTLVSGPVALNEPVGVQVLHVTTAQQMYNVVMQQVSSCDMFISVAAVADYCVADIAAQKIKKRAQNLSLELIKNKDIVSSVASLDQRPFVVGFAAETNDVEAHAKDKLVRKNLDMLVANQVSDKGLGFGADNNSATLFWANEQKTYPNMLKTQLADELLNDIYKQYVQTTQTQN